MLSYPKVKLPEQKIFKIDLAKYASTSFFSETEIWNGRCNHEYQPTSKHPRYLEINEDFAYMAGVYLGDGWVRSSGTEIGFAFNENSTKEVESYKKIKKYWEDMGYTTRERRYKKSLLQLIVGKNFLNSAFCSIFGHNAYDKKIPDILMINNPKIIGALLNGLQCSDGNFDLKLRRICYDSVNYNLISQIKMLYGYMGIFSNITKRIPTDTRKDFVNSKISYKLEISGEQIFTKAVKFLPWAQKIEPGKFIYNYYHENSDSFFFRSEKIDTMDYKGLVYDLSVEDDNSYIVNNCAVHNSGLGFILLYILGITQVNPLKEQVKTYSWRFLNPQRVSPLDVDVDISNEYRNDIITILQHKYCGDDIKAGRRRVTKVQTLLTIKSRAAIQVACRGLGVSVEEAQFLSSFITGERGIQYTLRQVYYGDEENNLAPNTEFINVINSKEIYQKVWNVALSIEGLVNGVGSHAGGVILTPKDIINYSALMKTGSGDIITQFDLHTAEKTGLIKWDLLAIDALVKESICLNLLLEDKLIEWQGSMRATYEKYIGVYNIDRDNPEIWDMINNHKIISFFQMEKQSGYQAISIGKPRSLVDLSALNSVMRLMAPEPGAESPLERYGRFKKDITLWYKEMKDYGLTDHEQQVVRKYAEENYGLLPNQENFMTVVQDPEIGGFDLLWADRLRKSIA